ncbi:unnamed protein product [Acanthosepion pharaonis]|uniref:Uncharacterized protein n=1 Tax=Acanthosepion pharaonis TaxID=158019 RepID=A0A812ES06_ACAPH|nr:unnamed protein product [Sepia pharaonis]
MPMVVSIGFSLEPPHFASRYPVSDSVIISITPPPPPPPQPPSLSGQNSTSVADSEKPTADIHHPVRSSHAVGTETANDCRLSLAFEYLCHIRSTHGSVRCVAAKVRGSRECLRRVSFNSEQSWCGSCGGQRRSLVVCVTIVTYTTFYRCCSVSLPLTFRVAAQSPSFPSPPVSCGPILSTFTFIFVVILRASAVGDFSVRDPTVNDGDTRYAEVYFNDQAVSLRETRVRFRVEYGYKAENKTNRPNGNTKIGAFNLIWLNTGKLTRSGHIDSSFSIRGTGGIKSRKRSDMSVMPLDISALHLWYQRGLRPGILASFKPPPPNGARARLLAGDLAGRGFSPWWYVCQTVTTRGTARSEQRFARTRGGAAPPPHDNGSKFLSRNSDRCRQDITYDVSSFYSGACHSGL